MKRNFLKHPALILLVLSLPFAGLSQLPSSEHFLNAPVNPAMIPNMMNANGPLSLSERVEALAELTRPLGSLPIVNEQIRLEDSLSPRPMTSGNQVDILYNGPEATEAMLGAMREARHSINLETYIFDNDSFGMAVRDLLIEKRRQGVEVNVIYDAMGSRRAGEDFFAPLKAAGGRVIAFNPLDWRHILQINNRDHRKILIVDGATAFTGGVNISNAFARQPFMDGEIELLERVPQNWRDTHIRVIGPAAVEIQHLFADTWERKGGEKLTDARYFPQISDKGGYLTRLVATTNETGDYSLYETQLAAIHHARHSIKWTTAYFAPNGDLVTALQDAARRGVDVTLILPGYGESGLVANGRRSYYEELLSAGVKIYERRDCMLHAKTVTIDGAWSSVGSANLDTRSFLHNQEANLVILGAEFARKMEALFADDLKNAEAVSLADFRERPLSDKINERWARLFSYWL